MTRMGSWGEVLVTVRDQRGERVDCMGRLHHWDFVGLWGKNTRRDLKTVWRSDDITSFNCIIPCAIWPCSLPHDPGTGTAHIAWVVCLLVDVGELNSMVVEKKVTKKHFFNFFSFSSLSPAPQKTLFSLGQQEWKPLSPEGRRKNKSKRCMSMFETAKERETQTELERMGARKR